MAVSVNQCVCGRMAHPYGLHAVCVCARACMHACVCVCVCTTERAKEYYIDV